MQSYDAMFNLEEKYMIFSWSQGWFWSLSFQRTAEILDQCFAENLHSLWASETRSIECCFPTKPRGQDAATFSIFYLHRA